MSRSASLPSFARGLPRTDGMGAAPPESAQDPLSREPRLLRRPWCPPAIERPPSPRRFGGRPSPAFRLPSLGGAAHPPLSGGLGATALESVNSSSTRLSPASPEESLLRSGGAGAGVGGRPSSEKNDGVLRAEKRRLRRIKTCSAATDSFPQAPKQAAASAALRRERTTPGSVSAASSSAACSSTTATPSCSLSPQAVVGTGWRRGTMIGRGSFGSVYRAQDGERGHIFAVKQVAVQEGSEEDARLQREIEICQTLRHPNIVSYLGHACSDGYRCIFLEYLPGGSIASILKEFGALDREPLRKATQCVAAGLHYLHSHNPPVVHRDIKGANLLVASDFSVKLADFGCSKCHEDTQSFTTLGSIPWMAPEVFLQDGHGRKADIWSLGCTVLEMAQAQSPWGDGAFDNIPYAIRRIAMSDDLPPIPTEMPEACQNLVRHCLRRAQSERLSARQVLRHPFLCTAWVGGMF